MLRVQSFLNKTGTFCGCCVGVGFLLLPPVPENQAHSLHVMGVSLSAPAMMACHPGIVSSVGTLEIHPKFLFYRPMDLIFSEVGLSAARKVGVRRRRRVVICAESDTQWRAEKGRHTRCPTVPMWPAHAWAALPPTYRGFTRSPSWGKTKAEESQLLNPLLSSSRGTTRLLVASIHISLPKEAAGHC